MPRKIYIENLLIILKGTNISAVDYYFCYTRDPQEKIDSGA